MVALTSPDVDNLILGKGVCSFKATGEGTYTDLGYVRECEVTLNIEKLDYFSNRSGVRDKVKSVTLSRGGTCRFLMDEWTPYNAVLGFMGGTVDEMAAGGPMFDILATDEITGYFQFVGANDVGPNWTLICHNISLTPSSSVNMIQETDWGGIEVTGEILKNESTGKYGTMQLTNLTSDT